MNKIFTISVTMTGHIIEFTASHMTAFRRILMQEVIDYFAGKAIIWLDGSCELETGFNEFKI